MSASPSLPNSEIADQMHKTISGATNSDQLDHAVKTVWARYGAGALSDQQASDLVAYAQSRRPSALAGSVQAMSSARRGLARQITRFISRKPPCSPDRLASRQRRRKLGGSGCMPDTLRAHFTEGERAVLAVVAGEVKHHGVCDLPIDKIAALAGVCRTSVQNALHEARLLGLIAIRGRPRRGAKNLTNLIEILSPEWRAWLKRGPAAHWPIGSKAADTSKILNPTKIKEEKNKGRKRGATSTFNNYIPPSGGNVAGLR